MSAPRRRPSTTARGSAFLSVDETASLLGVSRATLYRSIQRGDFPLPVVTLNARLRVPRRSVDRLLDGLDPAGSAAPTDSDGQPPAPGGRACPACGSPLSSPASRRPMCSAARRSSSSMPSV